MNSNQPIEIINSFMPPVILSAAELIDTMSTETVSNFGSREREKPTNMGEVVRL